MWERNKNSLKILHHTDASPPLLTPQNLASLKFIQVKWSESPLASKQAVEEKQKATSQQSSREGKHRRIFFLFLFFLGGGSDTKYALILGACKHLEIEVIARRAPTLLWTRGLVSLWKRRKTHCRVPNVRSRYPVSSVVNVKHCFFNWPTRENMRSLAKTQDFKWRKTKELDH